MHIAHKSILVLLHYYFYLHCQLINSLVDITNNYGQRTPDSEKKYGNVRYCYTIPFQPFCNFLVDSAFCWVRCVIKSYSLHMVFPPPANRANVCSNLFRNATLCHPTFKHPYCHISFLNRVFFDHNYLWYQPKNLSVGNVDRNSNVKELVWIYELCALYY